MDIKSVIQNNKNIIEKRLSDLADIHLGYSNIIVESMKYSLLAGGKRIRPCLFIELLKSYNIDYMKYIDVACSIEMIHTYSLIHDDLPSMDNDEFRRGKPTNHVVYGEDIAILTGDALLNFACEILFDFMKDNFEYKNMNACNHIIKSSGIYGMIGGQVSDIINENKKISLDNLKYIHENKTMKLLSASLISATYIADIDDEEREYIRDYGYNIGMAFQISDDILDITGDKNILGKSIGKDENSGKNTYPKYYGIEKSKEILKNHIESAINSINKIQTKDMSFFVKLALYMKTREY